MEEGSKTHSQPSNPIGVSLDQAGGTSRKFESQTANPVLPQANILQERTETNLISTIDSTIQ